MYLPSADPRAIVPRDLDRQVPIVVSRVVDRGQRKRTRAGRTSSQLRLLGSRFPRRGLSAVELLLASAILAMMAAVLGTLAGAVQESNRHDLGLRTSIQHGRVGTERIQRAIRQARANEHFPGCAVFGDSVGAWEFPDTLVIWRGDLTAANPDGLPLIRELVI